MFCPNCKCPIEPVLTQGFFRYAAKFFRILRGDKAVEVTPRVFLCRACGITWKIQAIGILGSADDELIKKFFPKVKFVPGES